MGTALPAKGMGVCSGRPLYDIDGSAPVEVLTWAARFLARENWTGGGDGADVISLKSGGAALGGASASEFGGASAPASTTVFSLVDLVPRVPLVSLALLASANFSFSVLTAGFISALVDAGDTPTPALPGVPLADNLSSGVIFNAFGSRTSLVLRVVFKLATAFFVAWLISCIFSSTARGEHHHVVKLKPTGMVRHVVRRRDTRERSDHEPALSILSIMSWIASKYSTCDTSWLVPRPLTSAFCTSRRALRFRAARGGMVMMFLHFYHRLDSLIR